MDDVLQRKQSRALPIHKRKMFTRSSDIIFEQDCCTNSFGECISRLHGKYFPAHTPTLWRFTLFFWPKWDDFWSIERLWTIQSQRVYRNPRPTHIKGVMRRLWEEVKFTDPKIPTRLVHELPTKINEISA